MKIGIDKIIRKKTLDSIIHNIQSDLGKRLINGAFWSLTGSVISKLLLLLSTIIIARLLGQTHYGEFGIIRSTINMFSVFAGFGIGMTATKYIAEYRAKSIEKVSRIITLSNSFTVIAGAAITVILILLSNFIAAKTINAPQLGNELKLGAIILFFAALNGAQAGILAGFEKFKKIATINAISGIISFPIQIVFTYVFGLKGAILGFGSNYIIQYIAFSYNLKKLKKEYQISKNYRNSLQEAGILWKFSLPAVLAGLLVTPVMWACNAIVVNLPNGYNEFAIFDAANQWRNAILFIPASVSQIVLPILSNTIENRNEYLKVIKVNILLNFLITTSIFLLLIIFSNLIMGSYGEGFKNSSAVFAMVIGSSVFISINSVIGQILISQSRVWIGFLFNFIWAITIISLTKFFSFFFGGAESIALALLISYIFHTIWQGIYLNSFLKKYN